MSVELEPAELGFKRPFTHEVSQVLRLHNTNNDPVAFKVKTTAPKQYCVRPNSGRIDAGKDVEVQVLLQAMKEDPPPDTKCRDKFLVQSVAIKADNDSNVSQIWSNIEQTAKSQIIEKKIRVNFLPADGSGSGGATTSTTTANDAAMPAGAAAGGVAAATAAATTNGVASSTHEDDQPPSYSSPSPQATTPQRTPATTEKSISSPSDFPTETSTTAPIIPTSSEDLKRQLDEAKATITRLQSQAQESLRQRKPQEGAERAAAAVQQKMQEAPGGVPLQVVAVLCLICFLIAWIFF